MIGSSIKTKFEISAGQPVLVRLSEVDFGDDRDGKPVGINQFIGRRPIVTFGNSHGDQQMMEWTTTRNGLRLTAIIHHTDADREYAYDANLRSARLTKRWMKPRPRWVVVNMKCDWKTIFPPDATKSSKVRERIVDREAEMRCVMAHQ